MPRALWWLLVGMALNVTGASFLWPLNTIYLHEQLGQPLAVAGVVLMLNSGGSVIGSLAGGFLFDRIGGFRVLLAGAMLTIAALGGLSVWHGWPHYAVFLAFVGVGSGVVFPAASAYAGAIWPEGGRRAFNALYVAQNIGVAVGSALGGLVASYSFSLVFFANLLLYAAFLFTVVAGLRRVPLLPPPRKKRSGEAERAPSRSAGWALALLCAGYGLCWLSYVQWSTTIAAYTRELGIPVGQYSLLWTINGALIVLAQPLLSAVIRRFMPTLKRQIVIGFFIFAVSFAMLLGAHSFAEFAASMMVLTIAEMIVWPAIPAAVNEWAPPGKAGFYQGIVNGTATAGRMIGPVIGGSVADLFGMKLLIMMLALFALLAVLAALLHDRRLPKRTENADEKTAASV
ncbi:Multidrug resistance protein B-like protein [Geobacillus thermoleovorans CCB_US3_UF5]|uniref:Multidrug resistance protein B-like protein n=2 Tax=Geobacillus thermoleovorans group TaxID=1505648 RepID=U2Y5E5_GEOKU|nr:MULTISPECIES: MFS transporter [Geobacillus]AEV20502.1 Multidrug resistance protein B-like protein [Geobacillus thermoleovorans CCB_US3_UF5]QDY74396.1 MFS transporter [Geobacillus thermoleovorans]GAD11838.1 multidrug resistance protein B-like protein [Geobacillus kaustophilus GBlys]GAJ57749.1 multidrug resistance protein [Geobacillus thermoleovorans B23]